MEKKKRDYALLLFFMILSFIDIAVVNKLLPIDIDVFSFLTLVRSFILIGWYIFLYRVTSNFYSSKRLRFAFIGLLVVQYFITGIVHMNNTVPISELTGWATFAYVITLAGFCIVFYIILNDIFTQKHDLIYSLLGASNIYFLIPIIFSYVYCLIAVHDPGMVGASPTAIRDMLFNSFNYSWFVIAGIDYPSGQISEVIQSLSVLESITGNLFIVFIIGRLMSK